MRIHIGGDHAAFETQQALITYLAEQGHDVVNHGPTEYDAEDDYPVYVLRAAEAVRDEDGSLGIVLGGSGNGEQMAANKVKGIRAALCLTPEFASLAREHNGAQILSIGGRFVSIDEAKEIARTFIETPYAGVERHARRLAMVEAYEQDGTLPAEH